MRNVYVLFFILMQLLLTGCGQSGRIEVVNETEEPTYRRADQCMREKRMDEALSAYLKVIDKRMRANSDAPESHLAVGQLYLQHVQDPIAAIHHLKEYQRLKPSSPQAEKVEAMILTAKKNFAAVLPGQPYTESIDRIDLMDLIKQLREENIRLKNQLALANQRLKAAGQTTVQAPTGADKHDDPDFHTPPTAKGNKTTARNQPSTSTTSQPQSSATTNINKPQTAGTCTVEKGDSLYSISKRVYGTGSHWRKIFDANRDQLPTQQALKPGMVLKVPPNP